MPCWKHDIEISVLSGGMTNMNYRIRDGDQCCVVRLGDDVPEHLILRENEGVSSEAAARCGFSPDVLYREPGILVIRFVDGTVFREEDIRDPEVLVRLTRLLKQFHRDMPRALNGYPILFWVFQVLRHYRNMLEQGNSPYRDQVPGLMGIADRLEQDVGPVNLVFGHNDLLPANFIDDGSKIWLIDFDYAGFNSPLFDLSNLASNSQLDVEAERRMLGLYFDGEPGDRLWKSYNAMKCASLLRETMWSMVSEIYSELDFDYAGYTRENDDRFRRAYQRYKQEFWS